MKAVDTNVVLRLMLKDNPDQAVLAEAAFSEPVLLPITVIQETAWVLGYSYGFDRIRLSDSLIALFDLPHSIVENEPGVRWAIQRHRDHGADIADMLHLICSSGASHFATFDRKLRSQAGSETPIEVETLC